MVVWIVLFAFRALKPALGCLLNRPDSKVMQFLVIFDAFAPWAKRQRTIQTRKIIKIQTLIAALTIAAMSALWSIAAPSAAAAEHQVFGDWGLVCEARSEGQGELCYLNQTIL